jgi:hypothetical protein
MTRSTRVLAWMVLVVVAGCECAPPEPTGCVDDAGCNESYCVDGACVQCISDSDCTAFVSECIEGSCVAGLPVELVPPTCDCGDVVVGATGECTVTLTNNGALDITILEGRIDNASLSSVFRVGNFAVPTTIVAGGSFALTVFCTPEDTASVQTALTLEVDAFPGEVNLSLSVQGTN